MAVGSHGFASHAGRCSTTRERIAVSFTSSAHCFAVGAAYDDSRRMASTPPQHVPPLVEVLDIEKNAVRSAE